MDKLANINMDLSPGQLLKEARTAANLTAENIAAKLYLKVKVIHDLENDNYPPSINLVFMKGYLRSYGKTLNIPQTILMEAFAKLGIEPAICEPNSRATAREASEFKVKNPETLLPTVPNKTNVLLFNMNASIRDRLVKKIADLSRQFSGVKLGKIIALVVVAVTVIIFAVWKLNSPADMPLVTQTLGVAEKISLTAPLATSADTPIAHKEAGPELNTNTLELPKESRSQPRSPNNAKALPKQKTPAASLNMDFDNG